MTALWSELLLRGAGDLNSRQHADALDRMGVGRSTDVGTYHLRIAATMLGNRVIDALPLITDMILRPRLDEDSIEPARDLALQALESLKDDPHARASLAARERHFPVPFNRSSLGKKEGLEAATRADLVGGWDARAKPEGSILAVAGAVEPEPIAQRLDQLFDGWTGRSPEPKPGPTPSRGYAHEQDETNQVQIMVLHDAPQEANP